ncbi:bifunctional peptidase and arginyl-hydroxylase JMJD5-like [Patiria miniata]|uniref:JmjC domain-containing protein n=1 Tax=Patiria miniata TaxID=46514 RepID=A0A913ZTK0_PATMI|nr:bifunctional peptidase and arginyl-hydroxylase JMJD5-like [Patiria miniata]
MKITEIISVVIFCLMVSVHQSGAEEAQSPSPPTSLPGHLKPLASKATRFPVSVIQDFPSPYEFFRSYVYPSVPVIIKQGARRSPAFQKWTDEYLKSLPESQQLIRVEMRKVEERQLPRMNMPFAEFLDRYQTTDEYLVARVPDFLKRDVLIPPSLHCTNVTANLLETMLWFSSGGTKSHVHTDYVDIINCLFRGQKDFLLVNYTRYRQQIVFDHPEGFYSSVDVERVDLNKFPGLRNLEFHEAKMQAGDCIYLPFKWIHQVNSFGSNVAVNIWWNHQAYVVPSPESCGRPEPGLSLADVSFPYHDQTNGDIQTDLHPELDFFRDPSATLTTFMDEEETDSLTEGQFLEFMDTIIPGLDQDDIWTAEALNVAHQIFQILDVDGDGKITSRDTDKFPVEINKFDPFSINLGQKMMILGDIIDGQISKQKQDILRKSEKDIPEDGNTPSRDHSSKFRGTRDQTSMPNQEL